MQVEQIDHVHIEVTDRDVAAAWYGRVLGLVPHAPYAQWADDPMGPLILATASGVATLSLFAREARTPSRDTTIAFSVSGAAFLDFLLELDELALQHVSGKVLTRQDVVDHDLSWSIYFTDPDQNRLEVTTYDYGIVAGAL